MFHTLSRSAAALALSVALVPAMAHAASADVVGIETTAHGVVLSSTLPHCTEEDGGPIVPCTWNVGPGVDGNGRGLAYVVLDHSGTDRSFDYVWPSDPRRNGWHWSRTDADCIARVGHYRCPDGAHGRG